MRVNKREEYMIENNLLIVLSNLGGAITNVLNSILGRIVVLISFMGAYFASISNLIHVILALVIFDAIFGISVSIKLNGIGSILSSKLRNTLFKLFFYLLFIMLTFLIEFQITGIECFTPKIVFAVMAGVELWSIASNALILSPNMPFLKLFKKFLTLEISKKLDMSRKEVEGFLEDEDESNEEEE